MSLTYAMATHARRKLAASGRAVASAAVLLWSGCFIDGDHRCDANQVLLKGSGFNADTCVCEPGAIPDARGHGCALCGDNEIAANSACVCAEGYSRATDDGPCERAAIGTPCTDDEGCSAPFSYCATDGSERYCSAQDCSATSCPTGYACEQASDTSYCAKLPEGLGRACTSDTDCASGEAKTCDTMQSHSCILTGCADEQLTCPGYYACCDVSAFVAGFSLCVAPGALTADEQCPFGTKVTP
jgi:hypothetical protein